jgi:type IV pilus assembly protein PilM
MPNRSTSRKSVVGLEIEPSHLAAAEVHGDTAAVERAATTMLPPGVMRDGEVVDVDALAEALKTFFREKKLPRNVRLGVANQRIVVRTLDAPPLQDKELTAAVRFEAQNLIPMPLDQAVLDFQVLGPVETEEGPRTRVILIAARRDMVERLVSATRRAGLRPVGVDLSAFAMIRALAPGADAAASGSGAMLYVNVAGLTNIAVAHGYTCLFTRTVAGGYDGLAGELAERCGLTLQHARQWLLHVGLVAPMSDVAGDAAIVAEARNVLSDGVRRIADEARNSLDFYRAAPDALPVEEAILCGPAVSVPGFVEELGARIGVPVREGNVIEARPGALADIDADRVAIAAGLATEERRA